MGKLWGLGGSGGELESMDAQLVDLAQRSEEISIQDYSLTIFLKTDKAFDLGHLNISFVA